MRVRAARRLARFGGQSHSTGYDGGVRPCKRTRGAVVDWRHSTNSRHFTRFFFFSRFDKP
ncbi:hypothetical protein DIE14_16470 [Burkholderia sp. Bp9017]|nr:hypothetical protein DIE14_16470 [Burkholderia sp. Bp9017]RQZ33660.1 hypothetical protein DIE13_16380 [Burkholderia sp. Bp9016]